MDYLGKSPIWPPLLIVGKLALFACCLLPFSGFLQVGEPVYGSAVLRIAGFTLLAAGLFLLVAALAGLGQSLAVGLPERKTELRTTGLYRYTRNPIYLGAFMMCAGSCLAAPYPLNIVLFVIAVAIHHRIIRQEEQFLEGRFGEQWRRYRARVPRYIGRPGCSGAVDIAGEADPRREE